MSGFISSLLRLPNYVKSLGFLGGLQTFGIVEIGRIFRPDTMACVPLSTDRISFHLRLTPADIGSFWQVLVKHEYSIENYFQGKALQQAYDKLVTHNEVPVILDIGANIGAATRWFCQRFPQARVIAVEPDAGNFALLKANTRDLPQVTCIHAAAAEVTGRVCITNPQAGTASFQTSAVDAAQGNIEAISMADLIAMAGGGALIVKMDVEGGETRIFEADCRWLAHTTALMIEIHDWKFPGKASSRPVFLRLANEQFDVLLSGENLIAVATSAFG